MLVVHGTFPVKPDATDDLRAAIGPLTAETRREDGCESYEWVESVERPGTFLSIEVWRSRADLDAHMGTEHVKAALAGLPDMLAGQPQLVGFDGGERIDLPI